MKKRILFLILSLAMVVSALQVGTVNFTMLSKAGEVSFDSGTGTVEDPYLISTPEQLYNVRNDLTASYKLTANIVFTDADFEEDGDFCNEGKGWTPIGDEDNPFTGTFDGDGHTIKNLQINAESDYVGLFGYSENSTIKNLGLIDGSINSTSSSVGGICGFAYSSSITNCYNTGRVSGDYYVGGICGYVDGSTSITNCYNTGSVSGNYYVGGICGTAGSTSITNCYNTGSVSGSNYYVGGICGYASNNTTITSCYNIGSVSGSYHLGGICGYSGSSSITNCYYLNTISKGVGSGTDTCTSCTLDELKDQNTFVGFDFENDWEINPDALYSLPTLKSIKHVGKDNTTDFAGGCGTFYNPYLISTLEQLNNVRKDLTASYKLTADIVFSDADFAEGEDFYNYGKGWTPIGENIDNPFTGTFDGDGHTIKNLQINAESDYVGLFGCSTNATIKNLGLIDGSINSTSSSVGGICGFAYSSSITNCYNTGRVSGYYYVGGICGYVDGSTSITNCYNTGSVSGNYHVGGICGTAGSSSITNCYNTGSVRGSNYYVGGICGYASNNTTITSCYNVGSVSGSYHLGGICGSVSSSTITNCYYLNTISKGVGDGTDTCTSCTLDKLKDQNTFEGFDFDNDWEINPDASYPFPTLKAVNHIEKENNTTDFAGGSGKFYNPYLISTPEQLDNVRKDLSASYKLMADIVFTDADFAENGKFYNNNIGWKPIGSCYEERFTGTFDGNGHTISNLKINSTYQNDIGLVGLFGYNKGTITNLGIINSDIKGIDTTGSICGFCSGTISNCYHTGKVCGYRAGGICGLLNDNAIITNCYNTGAVCGNAAGGICGTINEDGFIKYCYNIGFVCNTNGLKNAEENKCGGLVGLVESGSYLSNILINCYYLDCIGRAVGGEEDCTWNDISLDVQSEVCEKSTIDEMKSGALYVGFDFENVWEIDPESSYPFPTLKSVKHVEAEENTTEFSGGNGTTYNPYKVSNKEQLNNVRKYIYASCKLIKDIEFTDADFEKGGAYYNNGTGWAPISNDNNKYIGIFDGNGHIISNLQINSSSQKVGLFAYNKGIIKNLGMENCKIISANSYVDSSIGAVCGENAGFISNCYNTGIVISEMLAGNGDNSIGGICGKNLGIIDCCYNTGVISSEGINVGGICGYMDSCCYGSNETAYVSNCYNAGIIITTGKQISLGGICGTLVGENYEFKKIFNCYNVGVTNENGKDEAGICGSILGELGIDNCFYLDNIDKGSYFEEYALETSTKCTADEMKLPETYSGFDFSNIWTIDSNADYAFPTLKTVKHVNGVDGSTDFAGGTGVPSDPYLISTKEQLNNVRKYLFASYKLTNNIEFVDADFANGWQPIGDNQDKFFGTFDGNGYTISNLKLNTTDNYMGLFGYNKGTIKNLGLVNCNINSIGLYTGSICGYNRLGRIINCYCSGTVNGRLDVGGVCGYNNYGEISNCFNVATVNGYSYLGGISGYNELGTISNCYNIGLVKGEGYHIAAICGASSGEIENCYYLDTMKTGVDDPNDSCVSCSYSKMGTKSTFDKLDFVSTWTMGGNSEYLYPELQSVPMVFTKTATSISVKTGTSLKTSYVQGDSIDKSNGVLLVTFNDGTTEEISFNNSKVAVSAIDNSKGIGTQSITVTYDSKITTSYSITVYSGSGSGSTTILIKHNAVKATCTTAGNSEYYSDASGKYYSDAAGTIEIAKDSWVIKATGHKLTKHAAVDATATTAGNSEYYSCSVCDRYFSDAAGTKEIAKDSWIIAATGNKLTKHNAVKATCTTAGNSEYYSNANGKYYSDAAGKNEIAKDSWIIPAGHSFSEWQPYNETQHKRVCANDKNHIEYADHNWDEGAITVIPNCLITGVKTYTCLDCGVKKTEVIPTTEHTYKDGICTVCGREETASVREDDGTLYYTVGGEVDTSFNGFLSNDDGTWYFENGEANLNKTSVIKADDGKWYNVVDSKVTAGPTVAKNENGWWYIDESGAVDFNYTGFASNKNGTWYLEGGKVSFKVTNVIKNTADGKWYNVVGSKVTAGPTVAKNENGWWYIDENGVVDFSYKGFASNKNGTWYLEGGKVSFKVTNVIKNTVDGKWYNVVGSKVTTGPTVAKNSNGWWYIDKNGVVDFSYTGLASNKNGTWYVKNGKVDFKFNGTYQGYTIKNSKVVK